MSSKKLLALYGLKWNPFAPNVPVEGLWVSPRLERFLWQVESLLPSGGFAMITGEPGEGKSAALRILDHRLQKLPDVSVGHLQRPQSNLADFYREIGDLFSVSLRPHNRWAGFQVLRDRWRAHMEATLLRPVLLIDEAQSMKTQVLEELRILASAEFDSVSYLTVVLAGDGRLPNLLATDALMPLGTRIRVRLPMGPASPQELQDLLKATLAAAGNPRLMTSELARTLVEHSAGNYRILMNTAMDLLVAGAEAEVPQLDEKLYFDTFQLPQARRGSRNAAKASRGGV
jgi:type II secretory pathway predicted ATPase ExeA